LKIAVVIDNLTGRGGGEKEAYYLASHYDADIYTAIVNWDKILPEFKQLRVHITPAPRIELLKQEISVRNFRKLDLKGYDAVICLGFYSIYASWANHSAIWYAYGVSSLFYKRAENSSKNEPLAWKIGAAIWKHRIKSYDMKTVSKSLDQIITISNYSRGMMKKYYDRDSVIIHPPVEVSKFHCGESKGYYLFVARLEPGKRTDLAIEAFKRMPDKMLYIEGVGSAEASLKKLAGDAKNIKFLGRVSTEALIELYSNCTAFIGTSYYDDWSMVMVEAMASGKPCIAVRQGAYVEMVTNGETGALVEGTPEGIMEGVKRITPEVAKGMKDNCVKFAMESDVSSFYRNWDKVIDDVIKSKKT